MYVIKNIYIKINQVFVICLKELIKFYFILKVLLYMYFNFNFFNVENFDCVYVNNNSMLYLYYVLYEIYFSLYFGFLLRIVVF